MIRSMLWLTAFLAYLAFLFSFLPDAGSYYRAWAGVLVLFIIIALNKLGDLLFGGRNGH
jgi:hypothetical protein